MISLPIYVTPIFSYTEVGHFALLHVTEWFLQGGGKMELRVGPKQNMGKVVRNLSIALK